uniref:Gem-associated protein 2 n=1 Tax=Panagrolaimus sp. PS1159 TaxID=55785 RepID=A0AC35GW01_9BILA
MDQEKCYHVEVFDPSSIDVSRPATTVDEYLKQVVVNRMNCTEVAYAKIDSSKIKTTIATAAPILNDKCLHAPNRKWQDEFIIRFGKDREDIEYQRRKIKPLNFKNLLPQASDGQGWINICLRQRSQHVPIEPSHESLYAAHQGTPPTLRLVLSFSDVLVDKLLSHLFKAFTEQGYSRAIFEWFYALLLVVKVPLQHDTMAILRSFTKLCREKRAELGEDNLEIIREYTIFIAIVSLFFSQKDLAD